FRWAKAGGKDAPPFTPDAFAAIVQWSQGIPRLINSLCDSALLMAYGDESPLIGSNYVRTAAINLALTESTPHLASATAGGPASLPFPTDPRPPPRFARLADTSVRGSKGDPKPNSPFLNRLAERIGLP